jgi:hypothetical protein
MVERRDENAWVLYSVIVPFTQRQIASSATVLHQREFDEWISAARRAAEIH